MILLECEYVRRWPFLCVGEALDKSRGFLLDRPLFFLDRLAEESVAVPPGLMFLGGDEGGVVNRVALCVVGVAFRFGLRRLLRGPFGVGGVGDRFDIATWLP